MPATSAPIRIQNSEPALLTFSGLDHRAFGQATLAVRNGSLHVSGLGGGERDGVKIAVGQVQGFIPQFALPNEDVPIGASIVSNTWGRVDGQADQLTGSLSMERVREGTQLTPDFTSIGASTYELQLFHNGTLVFRQPGMSGPAGTSLGLTSRRAKACCRVLVYSANFLTATPFLIPQGPEVMADNAYFIRENPTHRVDFISAVTMTAQGMPEIQVLGEEIAVTEPFVGHQALGQARLRAVPGCLEIAKLGSNGEDGVLIDWKKARRWQLTLDRLNEQLREGAFVRLATRGSLGGEPAQNLATLSIQNTGSSFLTSFDFKPLQASSVSMEIRRKGETVVYRRGLTNPSAQIDTRGADFSPRITSDLTGGTQQSPIAVGVAWSHPAAVRVGGGEVFTGDEIVIYANETAIATTADYLSELRLTAARLNQLNLLDENVQRARLAGPSFFTK